ncbi:Epoxide hydrolase-like [Trema orientale]|uniref:Epoxide hydrolase-like n=1 Tax=Trema orientale TaxID=63057 RepID=A0A2P5EZI1_TREOI|nr:Epoxide hydrolase-like [Trema orientale]
MVGCCFSWTAAREWCLRRSFSSAGLKSTTTDLGDGTFMHCWAPLHRIDSKPTLLLIHGVGANAMWQWYEFVPLLTPQFNVYVPDLLFFGDSHTTRPERSESFQAQCVAALMEAHGVKRMHVVGISYGGFVGFSLAAQFKDRVERLVICCAGVCMEKRDMDEGMFQMRTVDEAVAILLPQTPEKARELIRVSFYKPIKWIPSCFLRDFIEFMCTSYLQERKELIHALHKDRKMSDLPNVTQPTLIIWGEHDRVFPMELAHRLKRHIGENSELVVIKNAGHAINAEKPKEMYKHFKSFLVGPLPPPKQANGNHINGHKLD